MNREIKEVVKLLAEIDKICKREGIPYYLGPQLTLCCVTGQEITSPHAGVVYMRTADMERFRLAVEKETPDGRIVESMNNNKRFYGFFLRYTDLDTLCFRLNEGRNYKYPGMGVDILPLRGKQRSRLAHLWTRAQEVGWNELADYYGDRKGRKKAICRFVMRLRLVTGRARLGKSLYRMLCKRMNVEDTQEYVVRLKKKAVYFPREIFDETETVVIDGRKFPVPGDTYTYLQKYYGEDYQEKVLDNYTVKLSEMVSARIRFEDYFQEVLPKLQSNFFISLIEGRVGEEDYERFLQNYRVDMKGPLFCCIIFHTSENDVPEGMNPLLLSMSVEREIKQRLMENCNCQEFIYMGNTILIMELHSEDEIAQLTDKCDRFCRWAWRIMGAAVTAGVGTVCNNLYDISISYEGAREAVSYRVLYGTKRAINIAEIVPKESKKAVPLEETKMQELFRAIHVGDQEKIRKEAIKETEKLHKNAATISQYNLATMEIVSGFFKFCANNSMDFNEISGNVQNLYERVTQLDESSMTNWIINMSMAISEKLRSTRNSTSRRIITDAQNIVKDRYMEPALSLDDVCADLGVSNSYFSSIFKKETGQSFVSYLTDYRMDRAEEMVLNTDEKSYKIAEKVGYQDANYFSYVFKKKFGVSPSKYRASGK